ncbi:MAG TPA: hypothetical protein VHU18_03205 [Rhizomicrobium sp.]|nr:hypothetical protein [Rhizomicrobium sp.]
MSTIRCACAASIGAAVAFIYAGAAAADASSETVTAATHAQLAVSAGDLNGVHTHLHHTLNCLVGPGGNGFDAKELNPCAQSGRGAIPDTADAAKKASLESAADKARAGLASNSVKEARADASAAASLLKGAK